MTTVNIKHVERTIEYIRRDGLNLALHTWRPEAPQAAIFYFHGLQSHAGWLWEVGCQFARNGVALYVLDRRGCGISDGPRNEIPAPAICLEDYRVAISHVRDEIGPDIPLGLFGHCLGGSFLAALMVVPKFDVPYESTTFCSAWLGKLHHTLPPGELQSILNDRRDGYWNADLKAEHFTDQPKYVEFIKNDVLSTRKLSLDSRAKLVQFEMMYLHRRDLYLNAPSIYICGNDDPIVNLDCAKKQYAQMFGNAGEILELPTQKHFLLFTNVRNRLINKVTSYVSSYGHAHYG